MTTHTEQQLIDEYKSRINKVCDYIENNMNRQLTLEELAVEASFSKYHFHRIFQGILGETPFQFLQRIRLERAATWLITKPHLPVSDISVICGFSDISVFSRNFKSFFKQAPTTWRKAKLAKSNLSQIESNKEQVQAEISSYFCHRTKTIKWRTNMELNKSVEVKELPEMTVAYIRHIGPYKGDEKLFERLWNQLFTWAGPRGLLQNPDLKSLAMYHDDPNITAEDKLRLSVCITVPEDTKTDGEIGKTKIEGGKYMVARFEVDATQFEQAWQWVYGQWLPTSGYQPDDRPCFEMYPEPPKDGKFVVDICVPVKPL